jgi:light-regulated signal transduction histidine kinase (bacteriophytochrome)
LRRANADLEQFSYAAAHDLQEPLRMVTIYSQMLKRKYAGQLDQQADEFIGYCVDGARRMEMLVRDLLAYTRATSSCDEAPPLVDLNKVVVEAAGNLQMAISESGASVVYEALPEVRAHSTLMQQLLQNLISNAIKYRSEEPPVVTIAAVRRDSAWLISVSDNGLGIAPEYREHIFGLFKRLHNSAQYPGTGLGLAICQRIVERYGGKIWVESQGFKGSTFFFTLPD